MIKRALVLLLTCMLSAIVFADSHLTIEPLTICKGRQAQLTVYYEFVETHTICNYQMEFNLPNGISVVGTDVSLGSCHTGHTGSIVNNIVVVTSMNTVLSGTSGVLLKIPIEVSGEFDIGTHLHGTLHNVKLGQLNETSINLNDIVFDIEITGDNYIIGDVNGDGDVDIADAVCIVNYVVGKPNTNFIDAAADANGDGDIDIADAVSIVNFVVGKIDALGRQRQTTLFEPE